MPKGKLALIVAGSMIMLKRPFARASRCFDQQLCDQIGRSVAARGREQHSSHAAKMGEPPCS